MSRMAAWGPGGRWCIVVQIASNVPHVQGKSDDMMSALMARNPSLFEYGDEKFWMMRYLPGLFGWVRWRLGMSGMVLGCL